MKISKRQLRRIIKEAIILEQRGDTWNSSHKGYHPLFDGSYAGNGYVGGAFEPAREFFEANSDNEVFTLALEIMDGKAGRPPYLPFGFADKVMMEITKVGGLTPDKITHIDANMAGTDFEYMVAYTDW